MDKVIIFDFDGVLADSLAPMLRYAKQVCCELGVSADPSQADLEALEKMEFSEFGRQLGIPEGQIDIFVNRCHQLFSERKEPIQIHPGIIPVISALAESKITQVITKFSIQFILCLLHDLSPGLFILNAFKYTLIFLQL